MSHLEITSNKHITLIFFLISVTLVEVTLSSSYVFCILTLESIGTGSLLQPDGFAF